MIKVLSKAYLEGRYGAIPVFSSFDFQEGGVEMPPVEPIQIGIVVRRIKGTDRAV